MNLVKVSKTHSPSKTPMKFKPWSKWKAGDTITGKYVANSIDKYGKQNYHIEVMEVKFGDKDVAVGDLFVVNSNGSLAYKMQEFSYDDILGFTYKGKKVTDAKSKFPGKEFHDVEVAQYQISDEDSL